MTYEELEQKLKEVETINKTLDKLNDMLDKEKEEDKQQILIYMEYLETEYRKLENEFVKIEEDNFKKNLRLKN